MEKIIIPFLFFLLTNSLIFAQPFDFGNFFFPSSSSSKHEIETESKSVKKDGAPKPHKLEHIFGPDGITPLPETSYSNSSEFLEASSYNASDEMVITTTVKATTNESSELILSTTTASSAGRKQVTSHAHASTSTEPSVNVTATVVNGSFVNDSSSTDEVESVARGTVTESAVSSVEETFYQKSVDLLEDAYTLSILIPVGAGVLFATTIILTIACCRCVRRCCRRRKILKKKPLPETIKNLRPSDQARLLSESSDDEF